MHKQKIVALLLLLMLVGTAVFPATLYAQETAVVNTGALNVRSGPGVSYNVVTVIYQGQAVTLLGRNSNNSWVKVQTAGGQQGWVNALLLTTNTVISNLPIADTPTLTPTAVITTGALNVRQGPGVQYGVVTAVSQGQSITLLGRNSNNSWVKVQTAGGQQGWINAMYMQANVAVNTLPLLDTASAPITVTGLVNTSALNVRSGPDVAYPSVAVVNGGTQLNLIGRSSSNVWVKVSLADGQQGWVNASLLILSADISYLPEASAPALTTSPQAVINGGALNVRSGPGVGYNVVATVYGGQVVNLLGRSSGNSAWVKVSLSSGTQGWLNITFTQPNVTVNDLPVVDGPPALATAEVIVAAANVRSGPSLDYASTAVIYQAQVVNLLGRNGDGSWVKVQLASGQQGWVNTSLLKLFTGINSLSVVQ
ncbi:MAG: SH3 domain-containing protein [Anaerolineales bacterium]|nr:SH3 domain-containing protein [Anaerolineales bacterium]